MSLTPKTARIVVLATGQSIPVDAASMTVGRQDILLGIHPDIDLKDKSLGRLHAVLHSQNGNYTVEDSNSLNKTKLNGVILTPKQEYALHNGDILRFGIIEVRFEQ